MYYFRLNNRFRGVSRYCYTNSIKQNTMSKKLVLFGDDVSPPVRFVMMTASMLKIDVNYQHIDLFKGENKSESFIKINRLRKVPALQAGEDVICDSHAIALYLCQISDSHSLYPEDSLMRARVNQFMFFNSTTLFPLDSYLLSEYFKGKTTDKPKVEEWYSALDYLEYQLSKHTWLVNDEVSLGDLCCGATVVTLQLLVPPLDRHVNVNQWIKRLQNLPYFDIHTRGLERLKGFMDSIN